MDDYNPTRQHGSKELLVRALGDGECTIIYAAVEATWCRALVWADIRSAISAVAGSGKVASCSIILSYSILV